VCRESGLHGLERGKGREALPIVTSRIMQKVQKTYTQEFKREAVRLAQTSGKPIAQVARELGISDSSIQECAQGVS
jgi:transposase-like protein